MSCICSPNSQVLFCSPGNINIHSPYAHVFCIFPLLNQGLCMPSRKFWNLHSRVESFWNFGSPIECIQMLETLLKWHFRICAWIFSYLKNHPSNWAAIKTLKCRWNPIHWKNHLVFNIYYSFITSWKLLTKDIFNVNIPLILLAFDDGTVSHSLELGALMMCSGFKVSFKKCENNILPQWSGSNFCGWGRYHCCM